MNIENIMQGKKGIPELKTLLDEIEKKILEIEESTANSEIPALEEQITELQSKIEDKKDEIGISVLESDLSTLRSKYVTLLPEVGQSITSWQPDPFTKGAKDIHKSGGVKILRSSRTVREIRANEFFEKYPFLAPKIAKCTIKDAEEHLKPAEVDKFCTKKTTYSYEVV